MILSISTIHQPATDLGFLLGKHPDRVQRFTLSFGEAVVFYPQADDDRCEVCLMLDVDTVDLVRGKKNSRGQNSRGQNAGVSADAYVNDRPYVASSLMSVAISRVFGTAISGGCKTHPELADTRLPFTARLDVLPVRGGPALIESVFAPLGYHVQATSYALDEAIPSLGQSPYYSVTLEATVRLQDLLSHLYVLIPVFDNRKHYFIGHSEVEKLLRHGEGWLVNHPQRDWIARRYLPHRRSLVDQAIARLVADAEGVPNDDSNTDDTSPETNAVGVTKSQQPVVATDDRKSETEENTPRLHEMRLDAAVEQLLACGATTVVDLGCGEGKLLKKLRPHKQFQKIIGMDVSVRSLEIAARRLRLDPDEWSHPAEKNPRMELIHGALTYRDRRLEGFDAAALVEVIEHLDLERLPSLEQVVFGTMRPATVIVTTPNQEYNALFEGMPEKAMRHGDHRFEWTRQQFLDWTATIADRYGYEITIHPVGPEDANLGAPSQMAVCKLRSTLNKTDDKPT